CSTTVSTTTKTLYAAGITPTISISTATSTVCSGNSVLFTANANAGSVSPSYQWKKNGSAISGATSTTYTAAPGSLVNGDAITCELTTNNPCSTPPIVTSNSIVLAVLQSPTVSSIVDADNVTPISSKTYCTLGSQAGYRAPTPGGTWSSSNTSVVIAASVSTNPQASAINAIGNGTAVVSYSVQSANGCITTANVAVVVARQATPSAITGPTVVCKGSSIPLSNATAGGTWYADAYGSINSSGIYTGVNTANAGVVKYTTTNINGCSASVSYAVTVRALPATPSIAFVTNTPSPFLGGGGGLNICRNRTFSLRGTPTGGVWSATNPSLMSVLPNGVASTSSTLGGPAGITYTYTDPSTTCASSRTIGGYTVITCAYKGVTPSVIGDKDAIVSTLYPNPATNVVNVRMDMLAGKADMVITDVLGKQVKVQSLSLGNNEIDITGLSKGFYLVSITTKGGKQNQKLVVE
ncbi:MAG: T9SS type A sorting domain-containing protein, partial [Bacteroidetes bacterium]|nr:T9SS type A sorting domain-containing protein [Bacteroidota bacterium]